MILEVVEAEPPCHPSFVGEERLEMVKEVGQVSCHHASCEVRPGPVPEKKLGVGVGHLCHHGEHEVSDLPEEPGLGKTLGSRLRLTISLVVWGIWSRSCDRRDWGICRNVWTTRLYSVWLISIWHLQEILVNNFG